MGKVSFICSSISAQGIFYNIINIIVGIVQVFHEGNIMYQLNRATSTF